MTLWLVAIESDDQAQVWWDEPQTFDSESQARAHAAKENPPPKGYVRQLYRCEPVAVLAGEVTEAAQ